MQIGKVTLAKQPATIFKDAQKKPIIASKSLFKIKDIARSCVTDSDCATLTPIGEFVCKDTICVLPCNPVVVPDECTSKLGQPYFKCDPNLQHCLQISESEELSTAQLQRAWADRDENKYMRQLAWWITQSVASLDFLAPIKCDFKDIPLQVVSLYPALRTGHTICKYAWFTNSEFRNKDASCAQVSSTYLLDKCKSKCENYSEGSQQFTSYQAGCDGFAPWCICQKTHVCSYDSDCNDLKAQDSRYKCVKTSDQSEGYCSI